MRIPFLQIEPTNLCNLHCVMCTRRELRRFGSMSRKGLEYIVSQARDLEAVKLQGMGEPLLAPEIIPMMEFLHGRGVRVYIATNGTVFPDDIQAFLRCVDRIEYSIDSVDPAEYARVRGGGSVAEVIQNLRRLCRARKRHPGVLISLNCVLLDGSARHVEDLFSAAGEAGVDHVNFNVVQNWSVRGETEEWTGWGSEVAETARSIEQLSERFGMSAALHGPSGDYSECVWARAGCFITWDGFVTPCCQRPNPDEVSFGNVFEEGLEELYGSRRYSAFREMLRRNRAPEECRSCSVYGRSRVEDGYSVSVES